MRKLASSSRNERKGWFFFFCFRKEGRPRSSSLAWIKDFVLPPRRQFTQQEKRRNVELQSLGSDWQTEAGLRLVHELKEHNEEMRWLAELFPLQRGKVENDVVEQRLSEWCTAHPDDARALGYLGDVQENFGLLEKAAALGDSRALILRYPFGPPDEIMFQLACELTAKSDAVGTYWLMECFKKGIGCEKNESLSAELLERAADLGSLSAYVDLVHQDEMTSAQRLELFVLFFDLHPVGAHRLYSSLFDVLRCHAGDGTCGSLIFAVGKMLKGKVDVEKKEVFGHWHKQQRLSFFQTLLQAVAMYDRWCDAAREACVAWVLIAKQMGLNKDIRRMIAIIVWETRKEGMGTTPGRHGVAMKIFSFFFFSSFCFLFLVSRVSVGHFDLGLLAGC